MNGLLDKLKQRNVFKVSFAYIVVSWLIIQVVSIISPILEIPDYFAKMVLIAIIIGFPLAVLFTWAFELTPDGIKRSQDVTAGAAVAAGKSHKINVIIIGGLALVLGGVVYTSYFSADQRAAPARSGNSSIAVLPLVNMSAVSENAFFAGGVHEELLTNLSYIDGLEVTSRTSSEKYVGSSLTVTEIGAQLDVNYVLEGSVRRVNNHVRVTVQLIEAATDRHIWANNYDRELLDVFAVQSAIAREISNAVHLEIQPDTVGTLYNMPTRSVRAYDLYQKARSIDRTERESEDSLTRTRKLLEQAVQVDPDFTEAWGLLNEICDHTIRNIIDNDYFRGPQQQELLSELKTTAKRALGKAVSLDPNNLETLLALASDSVAESNVPGFQFGRKETIDRILELYPEDAMGWYTMAWWYFLNGDISGAEPFFRKANELDPLHARILLGSLYYFENNPEMSELLLKRFENISGKSIYDDYASAVTRLRFTGDLAAYETFKQQNADHLDDLIDNVFLHDSLISIWGIDIAQSLAFEDTLTLDTVIGRTNIWNFVLLQNILLTHYLETGDQSKVEKIAKRLLAVQGLIEKENYVGMNIDDFLTKAHFALGDFDATKTLTEKMIRERSPNYNATGVQGFVALSGFDLERSVELILAEKANNPEWAGLDFIAIYWWFHKDIVNHPKIRAWYLADGKWTTYLASKIPDYADQ
jgi:TolB-like protein/tetratricopeptide (TPR) repeat protein